MNRDNFFRSTETKSNTLASAVRDLELHTYDGLMLAILSPSEDFTHWLLMNSPVGWVQERPLGAVHCTFNEAMIVGFEKEGVYSKSGHLG